MTKLTSLQEKAIAYHKAHYEEEAKKGNHTKRWIDFRVNKKIIKHNNIALAGDVKMVKIDVEWKKSITWGMNPTATVKIWTKDGEYKEYTGSASGCGYDKESSAVAQAFNESPELLKALYKALESDMENKPYGVSAWNGGVYFAGGVGMSCYRRIAEWFGLEWTEEHGKTWDFYKMEVK